MIPAYRYAATCKRVIDGDTLEAAIDLGFKVTVTLPIRLYGWNCPELDEPEGLRAKTLATDLLMGKALILESHKGQQTFARWLAVVYVDGVDVGELLAAQGVATKRP